ncbi:MAG: ABC transporter permease [Pseudomonadota bacterium]
MEWPIFDVSTIVGYLPLYVEGLIITLQLVLLSLVIGFVCALFLAIGRAQGPKWLSGVIWCYTYCFRGTPLLVQLFLIYFAGAQFNESLRELGIWEIDFGTIYLLPFSMGLDVGKIGFAQPWFCALLAFVLNTTAYTTEILQGAIRATARGEIEAARAYGMSPNLTLRRIILPSALRRALPAYGNEIIFMLHGSAIASVITIHDLTGAARLVNSRTYAPFEAFITAGLFYLALTFVIVGIFKILEKRLYRHLQSAR